MIQENVKRLQERILGVCERSGRDPKTIQLVAVSKTVGAPLIREAYDCGIKLFGENRLQEAEPKIASLKDEQMVWHFIGRIQTNKIKKIFTLFDVVQSMDREEVLEKANEFLLHEKLEKSVFLQVNISQEATKGGFSYDQARKFFLERHFERYPALQVTGLMGIGPFTEDREQVQACFREFKALFDDLRKDHPALKTLSMGMTHDFEEAIETGSTMIRIGEAIFGPRAKAL